LFILLLLGAVVALPLAELLELPPLSPTPASGVAAGTPAHAVTSVPTPGVAATTTGPPEAMPAPQLTATAAVAGTMPAATEETVGGAGGGTLVTPTVLPTATGMPAAASPTLEMPTPTGPSQLPAAGADAGQGLNWPALGLVAALLGTLMLGAGYALRNTRPRQW